MIRQKTLFLSVCVLCVFVACGVGEPYAPRVRLVKDTEYLYHLQWDAPLKEERIILYFARWADSGTEHHDLVYFPAGVIVSKPVNVSGALGKSTVEILSAHERYAFPLPAYAGDASVGIHYYDRGVDVAEWEKASRLILREHPFKPYRVGVPSRITFPLEPEPRE